MPLVPQQIGQLDVGVRVRLGFDQGAQRVLGRKRGVEEGAERDDPPVGQHHELVLGGAADGRFMQAQGLGHLGSGQRMQAAGAQTQEVGLLGRYEDRDPLEGIAPFLDEAQEVCLLYTSRCV